MKLIDPSINHIRCKTEYFAQGAYACRDAIYSENSVSSEIAHLLCLGFPATISKGVISVIVNPSEAQSRRRLAHVGKEIPKIHPTRVDVNSSRSIVSEVVIRSPRASRNHGGPNHVNLGRLPDRVPVFEHAPFSGLYLKTATGDGVAGPQVDESDVPNIAAITPTTNKPFCGSGRISRRQITDHFKPSKTESNSGYFSRHGIGYCNVMFSGGPGANRDRCDYFKASPKRQA